MSEKPFSFEDKEDFVDEQIRKRRNKWYLHSVSQIDYDDVSQIIKLHIYQKWDSWDQSRPLDRWLNTVIMNQIKNLIRDYYGNFARPCITCPLSESSEGKDGDKGLCKFTDSGLQDSQCPLYARWQKRKKQAHDVKLPLSIDFHDHEIERNAGPEINIEESVDKVHEEVKKRVNPKLYRAYEMLFVDKSSDEEVAKFMGYKTNEKKRSAGYKQIRNLKVKFKEMVRDDILKKEDILF